jgi:uncharacterized membrane-anchored protein
MKTKSILIAIFILICVLQIAAPASMIYHKNQTVTTGTVFKFRTQPIDPAHPFIGRYVTLSYDQDTFRVKDVTPFIDQQTIYIELTEGIDSYVKIKNISITPYDHTTQYVKAKINYINGNTLHIDYPFTQFYMEESKAPRAEAATNSMLRDSFYLGYAEVAVLNGDAVIQDVIINNKTIRTL